MADSKKIDDGGPAFAHPGGANDVTVQASHLGMSLRDWFAGQALPALLSELYATSRERKAPFEASVFVAASEAAYETADAMIAARKGGK